MKSLSENSKKDYTAEYESIFGGNIRKNARQIRKGGVIEKFSLYKKNQFTTTSNHTTLINKDK